MRNARAMPTAVKYDQRRLYLGFARASIDQISGLRSVVQEIIEVLGEVTGLVVGASDSFVTYLDEHRSFDANSLPSGEQTLQVDQAAKASVEDRGQSLALAIFSHHVNRLAESNAFVLPPADLVVLVRLPKLHFGWAELFLARLETEFEQLGGEAVLTRTALADPTTELAKELEFELQLVIEVVADLVGMLAQSGYPSYEAGIDLDELRTAWDRLIELQETLCDSMGAIRVLARDKVEFPDIGQYDA